MSVIIKQGGNLGPFKTIEVLSDRLTCDGVDYPFVVIGDYTISEDDSLAPSPPVPPDPVPDSVSMRQARLALLGAGLLDAVEATIAAMEGAEGKAAQIEWEYATEVRRDSPLVAGLTAALGLTEEQLDSLFLQAVAL
jgi:hypothetical protein